MDHGLSKTAVGHLAMLLFSGLVAGSFALGGMAAPHINPLVLNLLRFLLAAGVLGTILAVTGQMRRVHFDAPWRYLILGGLFAFYFTMMFQGLKTAAPVSMSAVFTLTPLMAAGFGWLILRQRSSPYMMLALLMAAAGAVWVIFDGSVQAILAFDVGRGEAIFFLGCIAHALYIPLVPVLKREEPLMVLTFGMILGATFGLAVTGLPAALDTDWAAVPPIVWFTIIYLSVISGIVTFFLVQFAALHLPGAKVMAYTYLTPAWVILWEIALGQGWAGMAVLPGVAAVAAALVLLVFVGSNQVKGSSS